MRTVWSEESKLAGWLEVELAATDAWAELGIVPPEEAEELRARAVAPTPARVAEIEERTQHDLAAFVDAVAEQVGPAARWLHYGLTSSDVLDTALALQIRQAGGAGAAAASTEDWRPCCGGPRSIVIRPWPAALTASTPSRSRSG